MSPLAAFGLIAGVATFAGVAIAIYYGRREGKRRKLLAYEADVSPFPIASGKSLGEYNLSLLYRPRNGVEERINNAYVHYLRFANFGTEPIRREDIAPANPLRLEIDGARVLDVGVGAVKRDVCKIGLGSPGLADDGAVVAIEFDFLDYQDGALIRVLTTHRPNRFRLRGDIIGMPTGVHDTAELRGRRSILGWLGAALAFGFVLSALALTPFVFRWVTGSWDNVWLLTLPVLALILPLLIIALASDMWPEDRPSFPPELLPRGFRMLPWLGPEGRVLMPDGGFYAVEPPPENAEAERAR